MKEWAKRLALLGASLAVVVLLSDLSYRWIVEPEPVVPTELGIYDDTLGWALRPDSEESSEATGQEVVYTINSAGQRDDEATLEKPAGTFRIVFLGDSRTFGYGVPIDKHFTRLIEGYFDNARFNLIVQPDWEAAAIDFLQRIHSRAKVIQGKHCLDRADANRMPR